ncbi:MAG: hypothetical protein IPK79_12055 [Vampirovibrionales bacterium]|nr:hypothetical protein [Vampirovibrionales bacterium]MBK8191169.1 hypothetical protein [Vampirovibrionales bacterium]
MIEGNIAIGVRGGDGGGVGGNGASGGDIASGGDLESAADGRGIDGEVIGLREEGVACGIEGGCGGIGIDGVACGSDVAGGRAQRKGSGVEDACGLGNIASA